MSLHEPLQSAVLSQSHQNSQCCVVPALLRQGEVKSMAISVRLLAGAQQLHK